MPAASPSQMRPGQVTFNHAALMRALEVPLLSAMEEIGTREQAAIEQDLSVPVERDAAGNVTVRSDPGDPPRMEDGVLQGNVQYTIEADDEGGRMLTIMAHRPPEQAGDQPNAATILEYGGPGTWGHVEARPFMTPALARLQGYVLEVFKRHLGRHLKK